MGAPSKYNPKYHDQWAFSLACDGKTDEQIADAMEVSRRSIARWKYQYGADGKPLLDADGEKILSSFGEKLLAGKSMADAQMEHSLFEIGTGYTYEEREEIVEVGDDGRPRPLKIRKTTRHVPPNVTAQIFWLKNRKPGKWRDRRDENLTIAAGAFDALNEAFQTLKGDGEG